MSRKYVPRSTLLVKVVLNIYFESNLMTVMTLRVVVVVVMNFPQFQSVYISKSIKTIAKKKEEAEPQGQALAKGTCR